MELFLKTVACVLITAILALTLQKLGMEMSALLTLCACCMVVTVAFTFLSPVLDFLQRLKQLGDLNGEFMTILLKAAGIGLISEIASMICSDAGNAALGKSLQVAASAAVLWISIPMLESLLDLISQILGAV